MNRHFSKEDIQTVSQHMIGREMQIRITARYHITPTGMAVIKKTRNGEDTEKWEPSDTALGNA